MQIEVFSSLNILGIKLIKLYEAQGDLRNFYMLHFSLKFNLKKNEAALNLSTALFI